MSSLDRETRNNSRILWAWDVESCNPDRLDAVMSVGLAIICQKTLKLYLKKTIYFPFHKSQYSSDCVNNFWKREDNIAIWNAHVQASKELGFDPESEEVPNFYQKGTPAWDVMSLQVKEIEKIIIEFECNFERENDPRLIQFLEDDPLDFSTLTFLLQTFLGTPPLSKRRLLDGTYQGWPRLETTNTDSQLVVLSADHIHCRTEYLSTQNVLEALGVTLPPDTPKHDHNPENDAHRLAVETAMIYNRLCVLIPESGTATGSPILLD